MKDYISREAVCRELAEAMCVSNRKSIVQEVIDDVLHVVYRMVKNFPAANIAPMMHGQWEEANDGTHFCSECGHDATYTSDGAEICGCACPFCGAKMKGE